MVTILSIFVLTISFNIITITTKNNNVREIKKIVQKGTLFESGPCIF